MNGMVQNPAMPSANDKTVKRRFHMTRDPRGSYIAVGIMPLAHAGTAVAAAHVPRQAASEYGKRSTTSISAGFSRR
jgi:hypothetical protein